MSKRTLSKREKVLALVSGLLVLGGGGKLLVLDPNKKITAAKARIATLESDMAGENAKLTQAMATRQPASSNVVPEGEMRKIIAENATLTSLIRTLAEKSSGDGLHLRRIESTKIEAQEGYQKANYSIDVEAPYLVIGRFIQQIEESGLLVEVESLKISRNGDDLRMVIANVSLNNYVIEEMP